MDEASFRQTMRQGLALAREQRFADAEAIFRQVATERPDDGMVAMNLAAALASQGKFDEALPWLDRSAALRPDDPGAHFNRGRMLNTQKRFAEAQPSLERAHQLAPDSVDILYALAICNQMLGRDGMAAQQLERVLEVWPDHVLAHAYISQALRELGHFEPALQHIARAVELQPDNPQLRYVYGLSLLLEGQWEPGWIYAESRWRTPENIRSYESLAGKKIWDGSPLPGETIYVHPEQGLGDMVQFIRYAPQLAERVGRVVVGCRPAMKELIESVDGVAETFDMFTEAPPAYACWVPLLSLPRIFKARGGTIPTNVPYLRVDAHRISRWANRIGPRDDGTFKVGLAWAGNPEHMRDVYRSTTLAAFAPLANVKGVKFFSLQKGAGSEQAKSPPAGMELIDLAPELHDLSDTAAAIQNLDLVIGVDTAVVHLAGALGKEVWTLLGYSPDWRWMRDREDSPWYPTMKLMRQSKLHDWGELMRRVGRKLEECVRAKKG